ncbi:extracellular solute-binding protein [Mycolicibacterium arenosum]|uniref:Extracellular solute-binding protein n=1 Tax=Mycolicibacterium arenosum TaxID=2952157 RepID=A0ABT1MBK8_9MYCO|nr:extracellular solute-binding protein [Mycolicibacterium sp. CAU 1645]MCP9276559.1 extracellular solute-binding protein [Mycolicibacterium sp. CAU 1645]
MRHQIAIIAAIGLIASGCGNGQSDLAGPGGPPGGQGAQPAAIEDCNPNGATVTTSYKQEEDPAFQAAKATMEKRFPGLTVKGKPTAAESYDEFTRQIVADTAAGTRYDVAQVGNNQIRFFVDTYKPASVDTSRLRDTYKRNYLDIGTVNGKVYAVPIEVSIPVLYYNKTRMAEAALDPARPPQTYPQLYQAARALATITNAAPVHVRSQDNADWIVQAAVQSAGGQLVAPDGTAAFNTPQGISGISIYSALTGEGLMTQQTDADAQAAFNRGDLPLLISSNSRTETLASEIGTKFDWGVAPMPVPEGGAANFPAGGSSWLVLSQEPCQAAFASALISELLNPEVLAKGLLSTGYIATDERAEQILLASPAISPQQRTTYSYDPQVTQWGGWPGQTTPKINKTVVDMVQQLVRGAPLEPTVAQTDTAIDRLIKP